MYKQDLTGEDKDSNPCPQWEDRVHDYKHSYAGRSSAGKMSCFSFVNCVENEKRREAVEGLKKERLDQVVPSVHLMSVILLISRN